MHYSICQKKPIDDNRVRYEQSARVETEGPHLFLESKWNHLCCRAGRLQWTPIRLKLLQNRSLVVLRGLWQLTIKTSLLLTMKGLELQRDSGALAGASRKIWGRNEHRSDPATCMQVWFKILKPTAYRMHFVQMSKTSQQQLMANGKGKPDNYVWAH